MILKLFIARYGVGAQPHTTRLNSNIKRKEVNTIQNKFLEISLFIKLSF